MNSLAVIGLLLTSGGLAMFASGLQDFPVILHPFSYNNMLKHASSSLREKRQISLDAVFQCVADLAAVQCSSGLAMGLVNEYATCGRNDLAMFAASQCASNEAGQLCASQFVGSINTLVSIASSCATAVSGGTCPSQCRVGLESIRNSLGCCIDSIINTTLAEGSFSAALMQFAPYFTYSLWSRCGVDTVTECTNIPSFTPGSRTPPCTDTQALQAVTEYQCIQVNIQSVLNAATASRNCASFGYAQTIVNACGRNPNGNFCAVDVAINPTTAIRLLQSVFSNCGNFLVTQSCTSSCRTAIESFRDNSGCCVNNIYNQSLLNSNPSTSLPTSNALWNECGVASPGFCPSTLMVVGSARAEKAFSLMMIAIATMVAKFIY